MKFAEKADRSCVGKTERHGHYCHTLSSCRSQYNKYISIVAAFSIHSYGNVMIFPWGYGPAEPHDNAEEMSRLAYKMVNAIKWYTKDREIYVPGTAYQAIFLSDLKQFKLIP